MSGREEKKEKSSNRDVDHEDIVGLGCTLHKPRCEKGIFLTKVAVFVDAGGKCSELGEEQIAKECDGRPVGASIRGNVRNESRVNATSAIESPGPWSHERDECACRCVVCGKEVCDSPEAKKNSTSSSISSGAACICTSTKIQLVNVGCFIGYVGESR